MDYSKYVHVDGFVSSAYRYVENEGYCKFVDWQMCLVKTLEGPDDPPLCNTNGNNYWIIEPLKPKGIEIKNQEYWNTYVKWIVTFSSISSDENKEWDFKNNKVYESNIS